MKKDVIYIDIEDDITSIIDKVKSAGANIVALVPPKRVGVLQSAVNLKLLQKAATGSSKRVVLITNDRSLSALAAGVKIPVAKNLQSKPEIAPIEALEVDDSDIIKGEDLPVGELAGTAGEPAAPPPTVNEAAKAASDALDDDKPKSPTAQAAAAGGLAAAAKKKGKGGPKIPNFDIFRKKMFLIIGGSVLLLIFLVWAIFFAPRATVTITAKTAASNYDNSISLDPKQSTDISQLRLKPEVRQIKKQQSTEFDTTGQKEIGNKASGSITVTNCEYPSGFTIPGGAVFRADNGLEFTATGSTPVPGYTQQSNCDEAQKAVAVQAEAIGPEYNLAAQDYALAGEENIDAEGGAMSGGSKEKVQVVSAEDVEKAQKALTGQDANEVKDELIKQFNGDVIIIQESFVPAASQPTSAPAVGEQAKRAKLTVETTYSILAVQRGDVKNLINDFLNSQISDKEAQRIYSSGDRTVRFSSFQPGDNGTYNVKINTVGYIGPAIETDELAKQLEGKRYGEIEQTVQAIDGVEKVEIDFSPFWVTTAPGADKIQIKFSVLNDTE